MEQQAIKGPESSTMVKIQCCKWEESAEQAEVQILKVEKIPKINQVQNVSGWTKVDIKGLGVDAEDLEEVQGQWVNTACT